MLVERSAFLFPRCNCSLSELGTYVRTTDGTVHVGKKNEKRMLLRRLADAARERNEHETRRQKGEGGQTRTGNKTNYSIQHIHGHPRAQMHRYALRTIRHAYVQAVHLHKSE